MLIVNILTGSGIAGAFAYGYYHPDETKKYFPSFSSSGTSVLKSFEEGKGFNTFKSVDDEASVPRPKLQADLKRILYPQTSKQYSVIVGQIGSGKSTAVRKVLSQLPYPKGAVYFGCPEDPRAFSTSLAEIIQYSPTIDMNGGFRRYLEMSTREEKPPDLKDEPSATFLKIRKELLDTAAAFKVKHCRPMVLVLDAVDILAKKDPLFFADLQDFAKLCADRGDLRIVFISSDGSALPLLMSRSAWFRAEKPPHEVLEISDGDAVSYLTSKGIPEDAAIRAVQNITGGLFVSLNDYVSNYNKGMTHVEIMEILDIKIEKSLLNLELDPNHIVFQQLVAKNGVIITTEASKLGLTDMQVQNLLDKNILAVHPNETYTFHDRRVAVWFANNISKDKK